MTVTIPEPPLVTEMRDLSGEMATPKGCEA